MWPLTKLEASLARNTAAPTRSSTSPQRRDGVWLTSHCVNSGLSTSACGELGLEVARAQAVDLDAVLAPVDRHALGQHLHRALAGGVGRDAGATQLALHRADVDDLAALAPDHVARHRLADQEHAVEVGLHQLVPVGLGELLERRAALHAGVVDEDVDGADLALRCDRPPRRPPSPAVTSKAAVSTCAPSARSRPAAASSLSTPRAFRTTRAPAPASPRASA